MRSLFMSAQSLNGWASALSALPAVEYAIGRMTLATDTAEGFAPGRIRCMTEDDIIQCVAELPGVVVVTASQATAAPEVSWGDSFFFYDPEGDSPANRRFPFATIVTKDYEGFDYLSHLNRPGVFRLNIAVGRSRFQDVIGYPPADHPSHHSRLDYTALDRLLPHPVYAAQAWVSILNPGDRTSEQALYLLTEAHTRATERHRPRHDTRGLSTGQSDVETR